jgi:hypothetical protein
VPGFEREVLQRRAVLHAGVVEEYLDGADVALHAGNARRDGVRVRHVEGGDRGCNAVLVRQGLLGAGEARGIAAVEDDRGPGRSKGLGDRETDAFAGPGDECDATGEIEQLQAFPHCLRWRPVSRGLRDHVSDNGGGVKRSQDTRPREASPMAKAEVLHSTLTDENIW